MMLLDPRHAWIRRLVTFTLLLAIWRRPGVPTCSIRCMRRARAGLAGRSLSCSPMAVSGPPAGNLHRGAQRPRARHCRRRSARVVAALVPLIEELLEH